MSAAGPPPAPTTTTTTTATAGNSSSSTVNNNKIGPTVVINIIDFHLESAMELEIHVLKEIKP
jgi:hypothetical protein